MHGGALFHQRLLQLLRSPLRGRGGSYGIEGIQNQIDRVVLAELRECLGRASQHPAGETRAAKKLPPVYGWSMVHVDLVAMSILSPRRYLTDRPITAVPTKIFQCGAMPMRTRRDGARWSLCTAGDG